MEELRKALESVSDSYSDFVNGIMNLLEEDEEQAEEMIQFINDNPDAKTDECLDFLREYIDGLEDEDEE